MLFIEKVGTLMTGIYVILAELNATTDIQVGKRYRLAFEKAFYGYVGSALSGLEHRLARHLSAQKKPHWHIDYLLNSATVRAIVYAESKLKDECLIAQALSQKLMSVPRFGCSDCHCPSHLFFSHDLGTLKRHVVNAFKDINLNPVVSA